MDIYNYLKKDHQVVNQLFEQILATKNKKQRQAFFDEVSQELLIHAEAEHNTFYKAIKKNQETQDEIKHADKEHAEVKEYLAKLSEVAISSEEWLVLFGELKHSVEHHVKKEEGEIFKKAKKILDKQQARRLAEEMGALKQDMLDLEDRREHLD